MTFLYFNESLSQIWVLIFLPETYFKTEHTKRFTIANIKSQIIFFWIHLHTSFSSPDISIRIVVKANNSPLLPQLFFIICHRLSLALINSDKTEQSEEVQLRVKFLEIVWNCALPEIEGLIFALRVIKQDYLVFQPLLFCYS